MTESSCSRKLSLKEAISGDFQPLTRSILFTARTKGTLASFRIPMLSSVWGITPSRMSTTRIARSAMLPPRFRSVKNASCPGVSIKSSPGIVTSKRNFSRILPERFFTTSVGTCVAPMACVIPPASFCAIAVCLILSSRLVFPASTCPKTVIIGWRKRDMQNTFCGHHKE